MEYLQISDPWLRRALDEYLRMQPDPMFGVRADNAPVNIRLADGQYIVTADGQEIERFTLPLRLPALVYDLVWFFTQRRERANSEIALGHDYVLYPHEFRLGCGDLTCTLTGREVAMLQFMAITPECSKDMLLSDVWRYHPDSDTHTVETHLWRLRQKLVTAGMTAPLIITTDKGYKLA
jgi:DNA-binding response OmpR family regulator